MPIDEIVPVVQDIVAAEMVDCAPPSDSPAPVPVNPDATPTAQALIATIEQTGAGPPPEE